jgi:hypothetical protein
MRYSATIYANDVMDQVVLSVAVWADDGWGDRPTLDVKVSTQVPGVGESDATEWLKDALIAVIEAL